MPFLSVKGERPFSTSPHPVVPKTSVTAKHIRDLQPSFGYSTLPAEVVLGRHRATNIIDKETGETYQTKSYRRVLKNAGWQALATFKR
jgi:hypothetical protein